jgi:hypothetical protein
VKRKDFSERKRKLSEKREKGISSKQKKRGFGGVNIH